MDNKCATRPLFEQDEHLSIAVEMLRVRVVTISVLRATLTFLSSSGPRPSKWSLVSKLMHKRLVACEGEIEQMNEFDNADVALSALSQHIMDKNTEIGSTQVAQKRLGFTSLTPIY